MMPEHIEKLITEQLQPGKLEGWMTPERGLQIAELVLEHKPKVVVEIGVFGARSLFCIALALRHNNNGGQIYGIDPWEKGVALEGEQNGINRDWWTSLDIEAIHQKAMQTIWTNNLDKWAVIIRSGSHHCHSLFTSIDMLNIDGNHNEFESCRDVELYVPKIKPGGFLWFDDSDWPSTQKALKIVEQTCTLIRDDGRITHQSLYQKRPSQ
jgi:hypothetical protein